MNSENQDRKFADWKPTDEDLFEFDYESAYLASLFTAIDSDLKKLRSWLDWHDPEGPGVEIDQIEHHLGVGLVAIQRYLASVSTWLGVAKKQALKLGPKTRNDLALAEVLNAGANHWKHELDRPDWEPWEETRQTLEAFGYKVPMAYIAGNLVHDLGAQSLTELLGQLAAWRGAVLEQARRGA